MNGKLTPPKIQEINLEYELLKKVTNSLEVINIDDFMMARLSCPQTDPAEIILGDNIKSSKKEIGAEFIWGLFDTYRNDLKKQASELKNGQINYVAIPHFVYMICAWCPRRFELGDFEKCEGNGLSNVSLAEKFTTEEHRDREVLPPKYFEAFWEKYNFEK